MAANFLELLILILGTAGISFSSYQDYDWIERYNQYNPFAMKIFRDQFGIDCHYLYGPFACKYSDTYSGDPDLHFELEELYRRKHPNFPNPYFRRTWPLEERPVLEVNLGKNMNSDNSHAYSKSSVSSTQQENTSDKQATKRQYRFSIQPTSTYESSNPTESDAYSSILTTSSSLVVSSASPLQVSDQKIHTSKIPPESSGFARISTSNYATSNSIDITSSETEYKFLSSLKKEGLDLMENQNTFSTQVLNKSPNDNAMVSSKDNEETEIPPKSITDAFTEKKWKNFINKLRERGGPTITTNGIGNEKNETPSEFVANASAKSESEEFIDKIEEHTGSTFLNNDPVVSYSTVLETKGEIKTTSFPSKTSFSQETLLPDEESLNKAITVLRDSFSVIARETTSLDDEVNFSAGILSTNIHDSKLESTISSSVSFPTTNKDISLKTKLSSLEKIPSSNTENLETESLASQSLTASTNDDNTLHSKLSSFEIKSTTTETSEEESTTKNFISSTKVPIISSTDKVTDDSTKETITSTKSTLSKTQITLEAITAEHDIEISSIKTARVVITTVFIMIALIAFIVLAVYIFRMKRRAVHYDQLLLLP